MARLAPIQPVFFRYPPVITSGSTISRQPLRCRQRFLPLPAWYVLGWLLREQRAATFNTLPSHLTSR